jgi:uncharacterized protein YchJ
MTEPTQAQIEDAVKLCDFLGLDVYQHYESAANGIAKLIAHIRREARNAALEEAAKACNLPNNFIPADCADSIRALKDQP